MISSGGPHAVRLSNTTLKSNQPAFSDVQGIGDRPVQRQRARIVGFGLEIGVGTALRRAVDIFQTRRQVVNNRYIGNSAAPKIVESNGEVYDVARFGADFRCQLAEPQRWVAAFGVDPNGLLYSGYIVNNDGLGTFDRDLGTYIFIPRNSRLNRKSQSCRFRRTELAVTNKLEVFERFES